MASCVATNVSPHPYGIGLSVAVLLANPMKEVQGGGMPYIRMKLHRFGTGDGWTCQAKFEVSHLYQ